MGGGEELQWEKTYENAKKFVGRVYFDEECQGSFALVVWLGKPYIITCRHVVYDEDLGGIPIFKLSFMIQNKTFSAKEGGNSEYLGSTNSELDLSFFLVKNEVAEGFSLDAGRDVFEGQSIIMASYPSGLEELEGELENKPKFQSGRVSSAGSVNLIAFSDISGSMPNSSGAAMISTISDGRTLYGIHGGAVYYEDTDNKLKSETEKIPRVLEEDMFHLIKDVTILELEDESSNSGNDSDTPELFNSPVENVRSRGLHASDNIQHKGAMTYFITNSTIVSFLRKNETEFGIHGKNDRLIDTVVLCTVAKGSKRKKSRK